MKRAFVVVFSILGLLSCATGPSRGRTSSTGPPMGLRRHMGHRQKLWQSKAP